MMSGLKITATAVLGLVLGSNAQVPVYGQCGGNGYTGPTSCTAGSVCSSQNPWYYQCVPGTAAPTSFTTTSVVPVTTTTTTTQTTTTSNPSAARYFITFGDSYSQTGFDITGTKPNPSNPLGNPDLPGWTTTGGLNWLGFLVTNYNASLVYSYNLADGGATTDAELIAPWSPTVLSFIDQTTKFSNNLASKPSYAPWTSDNTLVGVWMGVNDVGNAFYLNGWEALITKVLGRYFEQLQIMYNAGVRKFVLLGVPPTQKTPLMLANGEASNIQLENTISFYNNLISTSLASFKSKNSGVTSWVVDTTAPFNEAINNPSRYGAPDATCYNSDGKSCLWKDNYHPGIEIQKLVAAAVAKAVGQPWFA
ncbi:unnamed protein product [Clonostachys rosea f. rosea IK726]|uniref:Uncharacterized protein n=1 Tax=Clonostachys rosea f. rosea IK726 TaxID=1349383 RepID=A0ACA9U0D7_BIOOC|nr:unnamed protein product [Clonostachys rosea f. rosea IK726]